MEERVENGFFLAVSDLMGEQCEYCASAGISTPAEVKAASIMEGEDPTIIHHVCHECLEHGGYREISLLEIECSA